MIPTTPPRKSAKITPKSSPSKKASPNSKKSVTPVKRSWTFPRWKDNRCPLFELPGELADLILGEKTLGLRDHLALAATCKTLRLAYTDAVWSALWSHYQYYWISQNQHKILRHIFTKRPAKDPADLEIVTLNDSDQWVAIRCKEHENVIKAINTKRLSKTEAKSKFKVNDGELASLRHEPSYNRHNPACPIQLYIESAVEALAFRSHGGPDGHEKHVRKLMATAAKAKATRERNGTSPRKRKRVPTPLPDSPMMDDDSDSGVFMWGGQAFPLPNRDGEYDGIDWY